MIKTTEIYLKEAHKVMESIRFRVGAGEFVHRFIDEWAYQQSRMYEPSQRLLEHSDVMKKLTRILGAAMLSDPAGDVLGRFMGEYGMSQKGTQFYPTPPSIAELMSQLLSLGSDNEPKSYYEPACGTGSLALNWLQERLDSAGVESMSDIEVWLEDIDPIMVKASFLQLVFFLSAKNIKIKKLVIDCVNTLSRERFGVSYIMERPE